MKSGLIKKAFCIILLILFGSSNLGVAFGEETTITAPLVEENQQPTGIQSPTGTDGNIGTNDNTGNVESNPSVDLENSSNSETANQGEAGIVTGTNETNYNTGNGDNSSGDADLSLGIANSTDSNLEGPVANGVVSGNTASGDLNLSLLSDILAQNSSATNTDTGADSENKALVDLLNKIIFLGNSDTSISNNFPINVDTGGNQASFNTGNGSVVSGDINLSVNIWNFVSTVLSGGLTLALFNIFGDYNGDILVPLDQSGNSGGLVFVLNAENTNTGSDSKNSASAEETNKATVLNNNQTGIENTLPININTGGNEAAYNTGNGTVESGDIKLKSNVVSIVGALFQGDSWFLVMVNVLGDWAGNLFGGSGNSAILGEGNGTVTLENGDPVRGSAENDTTGAGSENTAEVSNINEAEIVSSNKTDIKNNIPINLNTGGNTANYNTGNGSVVSGSVNLITNFINFIDSKIKANNIYLVLVNIFGDWKGSVKTERDKKMSVIPIEDPVLLTNEAHVNSDSANQKADYEKLNLSYEKIGDIKDIPDNGALNLSSADKNFDPKDEEDKAKVLGESDSQKNQGDKNKDSRNLQDILRAMMMLGLAVGLAGLNYQRKIKVKNKITKGKGVKK